MSMISTLEPRAWAKAPALLSKLRNFDKNGWALADQILISATNFTTMVFTARALQPQSFGAFTLVYSALLFANILQFTLVTQPHNVLGVLRKGRDYRRYNTSTAAGQLVIAAGAALLAAGAAVTAFAMHSGWTALLMALVPAIAAWQLQEFGRRVMYTEQRFRSAFFNDIISYGLQAAGIAGLAGCHRLTAPLALYVLAATSTAAGAVAFWQLRGSFTRRIGMAPLRENWRFGRWLAGAELLGWMASLNMYVFIAAYMLGTVASAGLKTAQVMFGPARVLAFFLGSTLPMRFTRAFAAGGSEAVHRQLKGTYAVVAPVLAGYCLLVALAAEPLLKVVFGRPYAGDAHVLALYSISALLSYLEMIISAALTATKQTHAIFHGYVAAAIVGFILIWPFVKWLKVDGVLVDMIVTAVIVNVILWRHYLHTLGKSRELQLAATAADVARIAIPNWRPAYGVEDSAA